MDFIDCETDDYIESPDVISSLTISGPPGTSIDPNLKQDWYEEPAWRGFWRDEDFADATNGFYTFKVVEAQTGNFFEVTDYLEMMPLLDCPTIISPADGVVVAPGDVTLEWSPVDGADYYWVSIGYIENDVYYGMDGIYASDAQVVVPNLPAGTDFWWAVRAMKDDLYRELDNESTSVWTSFSTGQGPAALSGESERGGIEERKPSREAFEMLSRHQASGFPLR
jgi:hypothetical protein